MERALLVGNGPNRVARRDLEWSSVLQRVANLNGLEGQLVVAGLPSTFALEAMARLILERQPSLGVGEVFSTLKRQVADVVRAVEHAGDDLCEEIPFEKFSYILTTNYDSALERAAGVTGEISAGNYKYTFPRVSIAGAEGSRIASTLVFHVHGHVSHAEGICIGYEHYAGQIEHMRTYLKGGIGQSRNVANSNAAKLLLNRNAPEIWPEVLLCCDVDIVGLGLGFEEIDLWWLLTFRACLQETLGVRLKSRNTVRYHCSGRDAADSGKRRALDSLTALGVEVIEHPAPRMAIGSSDVDYGRLYREIFKKL